MECSANTWFCNEVVDACASTRPSGPVTLLSQPGTTLTEQQHTRKQQCQGLLNIVCLSHAQGRAQGSMRCRQCAFVGTEAVWCCLQACEMQRLVKLALQVVKRVYARCLSPGMPHVSGSLVKQELHPDWTWTAFCLAGSRGMFSACPSTCMPRHMCRGVF